MVFVEITTHLFKSYGIYSDPARETVESGIHPELNVDIQEDK